MIKSLIICCTLLFSNLFAAEIRSDDRSVSYYIKVQEVSVGQYTFSICDKTDTCSILSRGLSHEKSTVIKLVKKLKRKSVGNLVGDIFAIAGATIVSLGVGIGVGAGIGSLSQGGFGAIPGIIIGGAGGVALAGTLDTLILTKWMNPKIHRQLGAAIEKAIDGEDVVVIKRSDMMNLAELLDGILLKIIK